MSKATKKVTEAAKKTKKKLIAITTGKPVIHDRTHGVADKPFCGSELIVKVPKTTKTAESKLKREAIGETRCIRTGNGQIRVDWRGHSLVSILRWMGTEGVNATLAGEWMAALGYPGIHATTVMAQVTSGRAGAVDPKKYAYGLGGFRGLAAELSKEEMKMLRDIRPADAE